MSNNINISLKSKADPTVTLKTSSSGDVEYSSGDGVAEIKFITTGEQGPQGAASVADITDGSITNSKLANNSVSSSKIASAAVTNTKISNGSVTNSKLASNAVTGSKIANGTIDASKFAVGTITNALINVFEDGAIDKEKIKPGSLTATELANAAVTTAKLADDSISHTKFISDSVRSAAIKDGNVLSSHIQQNPNLAGTTTVDHLKLEGSSPAVVEGPTSDELHLKTHALLKILSTSDGELFSIDQNGNITFLGTIDGRDLAVDGAKLDNIEAYATADQTDAEIRTAVENATDSNVFTDADHTKLNGIESGATADQTSEEIQDIVGPFVATGGTKTGITITYDDANNDMDFVVDHDAATNFVAEEHYRWDNDIQSTATINHVNLSSDTPGETEVLVINDGDAVWGHGEKIHIQIRNDEGSTISAGAPLYSKGEIGGSNRILVGVCDANDSAKMPCIGIAHSEMNTTDTKDNFAVVSGIYNTNISGFTSLAVGDNLYIQNDGSLSQTKPTGETSLIQNVAIVLRTNGSTCQGMLVSAIGRTNDVPNLDQNALFIGNASNQAVATDAPMVGVITAADAAAARTVLGVDASGTDNSTDVTLAGQDYLTLSGQEITANSIDLTDDVTGTLPAANGGTGLTSISTLLNSNTTATDVGLGNVTNQSKATMFSNPTFTGDVTVNSKITNTTTGSDLILESDGNVTFTIDRDNNETSQSFSFKNYNVEVANLDESGNLTLDGTVDGRDVAADGTKLDGIESGATADQTKADIDALGIAASTAGTVTNGVYTLGDQTIAGTKTFSSTLTYSGDNNHSLSLNNTSATGSPFISFNQNGSRKSFIQHNDTGDTIKIASEYGRISLQTGVSGAETAYLDIENDGVIRFGAVDSDSVLTTDGNMTFKIDADNDETGQAFSFVNTSTEVANINESGRITAEGGFISNGDVVVNSGANALTVNCGTANVAMKIVSTDSDSLLVFEDEDTADTVACGVVGDDFIIRTDDGGLKVKTQENAVTAMDVTGQGHLTIPGRFVGKQREVFFQNFLDDLSTTKHYLPFKDINEQTTIYQEEAAIVAPCDGRVVSVSVKVMSITGSGNMTIGVNTIAPNINAFGSANWTEEETETLAITSTDDYHVFHFAFDNAKHFDSGDLVSLSIQNSADLSGTTYWYVTTVIEYDWNTFLGTTSAEFDSNP